jgi:NADPH:quinone reductase-like Zn-dependent oxidoreductase
MSTAVARAVGVTRPGGPEVLEVFEREVRGPGAGEVRIAVRAAAVNPTDVVLRTHGPQPGADGGQGEPPWVPGMDAAGSIESVGEGVDRFSVGDPVMTAVRPIGPDFGAQAELIVVPAASVVPIPEGATFEQASTLPMNGLTAMVGIDMLGLGEGETMAVSGGAGVVASYAIPLAKERGVRVIADARPEDEELVRSYGADVVLPRGEGYVEAVRRDVPDGVDGFFDTALLTHRMLPAIRDGGAIAVVRGWEGAEPERGITVHQVAVRPSIERTEWLEELRRLASAGKIQLRVVATFHPEQVAEAQALTTGGGIRGRAVIAFGETS